MKREPAALSGSEAAPCYRLPAHLFPSFLLQLHVVFDEWKCGFLFEAGGMANR